MDRIRRSAYTDTFLGASALAGGLFAVACLVVGLAVVLTRIAGVFS